MSGKFVRASSFRHVFGQPAKKEKTFQDIRPDCTGQGNHIAANDKYFAISTSGGGGPVQICAFDKPGRQAATNNFKLSVHKGKVLDFDFNPFISTMIATASDDCRAKVSIFPSGGLTANISEAAVALEGHQKKVVGTKFHPTANNVLATWSADNHMKTWDIEKQAEIFDFEMADGPHSFDWNRDGSLAALTNKNKNIYIVDPRNAGSAVTIEGAFTGTKQSSVRFLDNHGLIAGVGFTKSSMRQLVIWDAKNTAKPLKTIDIDQSAGVMMTHYDIDNSVLYIGGKGDGGIKYFEIVPEAPHACFLTEFRAGNSQKGLAWVPKTALDTSTCEIARCLRLMRDEVVPISFQVPRKSDIFQADIFPETASRESTIDADAWAAGGNGAPKMMSLDPKKRQDGGAAEVVFVAKKSPAQLQTELTAANARIKELEAELAKLKA